MLVVGFAFAGHYMGQNAVAHSVEPGELLAPIVAPTSNIIAKGSLVPDGTSLEIINLTTALRQTVAAEGKGDMPLTDAPKSALPASQQVQIIPASVSLKGDDEPLRKKVALAPSRDQIEQAIRLKRSARTAQKGEAGAAKNKAVVQRRLQLAEENCLARAVYFEARSESELGQLAVAKVILNRVKDPEYPNTICGVVYQGSGRRNSCQFSFACDGLPDDVMSASAWANSKRIAQKAIAGDTSVAAIGSATNYHADYVKPRWARTMKRLIKIGHHVFYEDS
jgi:spore germination cell wall hydrolase CwlJ-like protein